MYTSYQEQLEYLDFVTRHDYDEKPREIHIRELARDAITHPETFSTVGWNVIIRYGDHAYGFVGQNGVLPTRGPVNYKQLNIRLVPALQGSPHVAQILAEQQIRAEWP